MSTITAQPLQAPTNGVAAGRPLAIELHEDQIAAVLEHASETRNALWDLMMTAISDPLGLDAVEAELSSSKVSQTLLRGLWLVVRMQAHGGWVGVSELAKESGVASSTVHRYLTTLLLFGLVEQHRHTRRYRVRQP